MKENRTLLILIGVMLVIGLAMTVPDYCACHPIRLIKSAAERRTEALEAQEVRDHLGAAAVVVSVDYNALTVEASEPILHPETLNEIKKAYDAREAIMGDWIQSYASHHGSPPFRDVCVRIVLEDSNSRVQFSCRTADSVERLVEDEEIC